MYYKIREVFGQGKPLIEVPTVLGHDYLYPNAALLWTTIRDHDVRRIMSEPQATVARLKLVATCIFTKRGVPVLYYGDELGMKGGDDPDNRHDFPGGWTGDPANAFLESGRTPEQQSIFEYVKKLAHLRTSLPVLSGCDTTNLVSKDQQWAFARRVATDVAVVVINNANQPADIRIPTGSIGVAANTSVRGLLGVVAARVIDGIAELKVPAEAA